MSKWRKALKNNRKFDARYFLNERVENQEVVENSVQQEEVKRNFNDFSFDSWLTEAEEAIDEAHCTSKRDDEEEELEEAAKPDFLDLDKDGDKKEPMKKAAKEAEEDKEELEEVGRSGRPLTRPRKTMADLDKDAKTRETDFLKKKKDKDKAEEDKEELEELQLGGEPKMTGDAKGMTPEEIRLAKAKEKMDLLRKASRGKPPVRKDVKRGLEESEIEEA